MDWIGLLDEMEAEGKIEHTIQRKVRVMQKQEEDFVIYPSGLQISRGHGLRLRQLDIPCASIVEAFSKRHGVELPIARKISIPQSFFEEAGICDLITTLYIRVEKDKILISSHGIGIPAKARIYHGMRRINLSESTGGNKLEPFYYPIRMRSGELEVDTSRILVSLAGRTMPKPS